MADKSSECDITCDMIGYENLDQSPCTKISLGSCCYFDEVRLHRVNIDKEICRLL